MKKITLKFIGIFLAGIIPFCGFGWQSNLILTEALAETIKVSSSTISQKATTTSTSSSNVLDFTSLTNEQKNAVTLLNYMSVLSMQINVSKESRIWLDEAYFSLYNNINPSSIDNNTKEQLNTMLDTLHKYQMLSEKRERIEYIYENNKAAALRSAIPDSEDIKSIVSSKANAERIISAIYVAYDSTAEYISSKENAELQYLQDGWELDDEEKEQIHKSRKNFFNYMITICTEKNIPGKYTLMEEDIKKFVEIKEKPLMRRIQFLESNEEKYKYLGSYWLLRADSHYDNKEYQECLDDITTYEQLSPQIFRKDKEYAAVLPKVVLAAKYTLPVSKYTQLCSKYCLEIINNSDEKDWAIRYFAALSYLDLYTQKKDKENLNKAYKIAMDNVNYWMDEQIKMNNLYLSDVKKVTVPKDATKNLKKEIKEYNDNIKKIRKTELPPICEPFYLNCELLFALADIKGIDVNEKNKIDRLLHEGSETLFLTKTLENEFTYDKNIKSIDLKSENIEFDGNTIKLPAYLVSADSKIEVIVSRNEKYKTIPDLIIGFSNEDEIFTDWKTDKVVRGKTGINSFVAVYSSTEAKKYELIRGYFEGEKVTITITPKKGNESGKFSVQFQLDIAQAYLSRMVLAGSTYKFNRIT